MTSEALKALAERVEAATGPDREIDFGLHEMASKAPSVVPPKYLRIGGDSPSTPFYTSSIDAALGLVERVLPGWSKDIYIADNGSAVKLASPLPRSVEHWGTSETTTPLAILSALLRAFQTQPDHPKGTR